MHTFLTRANALAAYTMSVLAALTFCCFMSTFLFETYNAPAKMNTVKVVVKHVPDYSASRKGLLYFSGLKTYICKSRLDSIWMQNFYCLQTIMGVAQLS